MDFSSESDPDRKSFLRVMDQIYLILLLKMLYYALEIPLPLYNVGFILQKNLSWIQFLSYIIGKYK